MTNQQSHRLGYGDYIRFRDLVLARSGLHFSEKKRTDLEFGLLKALQDAPQETRGEIDAYFHYLSSGTPQSRAEMDRLLNLLTVGETHFFRNEAQFSALAKEVLPALITRKRELAAGLGIAPAMPQLRIWSAGCATGEEPYSLAILLYELIPDINQWQLLILATDINQESLARAREARFSNWSFREPQAITARRLYFSPDGNGHRLRDEIRQMVTFARHNLVEDPFPALHNNTAAMDLILCRNVTIYFTEEATQHIVHNFHESLAPGGWLIVGHSEPSLVTYQAFETHTFPGALLYRKAGELPTGGLPVHWPEKNGAQAWPFGGDQPLPSVPAIVAGSTGPAGPAGPAPAARPSFKTTGRLAPSGSFENSKLEKRVAPGDLNEEMVALIEENESQIPDALKVSSYCQLARYYVKKAHWQTAQRWCQAAIAQDKLCAEAYFLLGMVYDYQGHLEAAVAELRKMIYVKADEPMAHFYLAMLYRRLGRLGPAQRALANVIRILSRWPPDKLIPESNERKAGEMIEMCRRLLDTAPDGGNSGRGG
jgi:chemotaxis protein methyltransferase CheR